jgi:aspartate/methionine/tyrosine aminotransferase
MTPNALDGSEIRYQAPYLEWAKTRPSAEFDLAGSNILACSLDDLPGAREAVDLWGANDDGYGPLMEAIAARYGTRPAQVTTASGTSGANFLVYAALLSPGDEVLVERPGYDPLLGAARMFGANTIRFERTFDSGYALDPDRVRRAMTPRTKLIVITHPHNPTGILADAAALADIGRAAEQHGAHVLVDEVYLDLTPVSSSRAATRGDVFLTTSSLTKSYGLSSLRCGWVIASEALTYRLRRAHDIVEGTGSIVAERLGTLAFQHLDRLEARARQLLRTNARLVADFLASRRDLEWVPSAGTVVFPRIRGVNDTSAFAERLLTERETAVAPGGFFEAPAHFRLGYGGDTTKLRHGLQRLRAGLDEVAATATEDH